MNLGSNALIKSALATTTAGTSTVTGATIDTSGSAAKAPRAGMAMPAPRR